MTLEELIPEEAHKWKIRAYYGNNYVKAKVSFVTQANCPYKPEHLLMILRDNGLDANVDRSISCEKTTFVGKDRRVSKCKVTSSSGGVVQNYKTKNHFQYKLTFSPQTMKLTVSEFNERTIEKTRSLLRIVNDYLDEKES